MPDTVNPTWIVDARWLRNWLCAYVVLQAIGVSAWITSGADIGHYLLLLSPYTWIVGSAAVDRSPRTYLLLLSLSPYISYMISIVYAYRVQQQFHAAGLYRHGPGDVVIGAVIFPIFIGWYIPASVLWTGRRVRRKYCTSPSFTEKRGPSA